MGMSHHLVMTTEWMTPEELAGYLKIPVSTCYAWRYKGTGPKGSKVGRHVRYRRSDVDAWLESQADQPPSAA